MVKPHFWSSRTMAQYGYVTMEIKVGYAKRSFTMYLFLDKYMANKAPFHLSMNLQSLS